MKYFLIFFIAIFFFSSAVTGACEEGFSNDRGKQALLRRASIKLERDLQAIRSSPQEPLLKEQGFKPEYYAGVDQAREFNRLKEYLHEIKADPKRTHISYFAEQIEKTIADFERDFKKHYQDNPEFLKERLKILEEFKKESQKRIEDQSVTYDWWTHFNLRLAMIASELDFIRSMSKEMGGYIIMDTLKTHKGVQKLLSDVVIYFREDIPLSIMVEIFGIRSFIRTKEKFPQEIMFFVTGKLGIMAFNKLEDKSHFIGVSVSPLTVDGQKMRGFEFSSHDLMHIQGTQEWKSEVPQKILKRIENISSKSDREKAELALFMYRHENKSRIFSQELKEYYKSTGTNIFWLNLRRIKAGAKKSSREMMDVVSRNRFFDPDDLQMILPDSVNVNDRQEVRMFLIESADVFANILLAR